VPLKTLTGSNLSALFREAETAIGPDAVIIHVRRIRTAEGPMFEVAAADPATATRAPAPPPAGSSPGLELMVPAQPAAGPLVIALVGPTGAGKTTTLAKLATHPRVFGSRSVGLIGLDTYRVAAIEELETYGRIAQLPVEIAYSPEDLAAARERLGHCDVLLVDTPGRSPKNRSDRESIDELLTALAPTEVHAVIAAGTPTHLAEAMLRPSKRPAATHLLVTKVDEAPDEGGLFELAVDRSLPIRWVADGQDMPFDLGSADNYLTAARLSQRAAPAGRRPAGAAR
jgi:flagellar biosynthesis protein FlhF